MSDIFVILEFENTQKRDAYIERRVFPRNSIAVGEYDDSIIKSKDKEIKILREALEALRDGFDNGLSVHTMHSIAIKALAEKI